ncbi:MAG: queuosine precursor transporter [Chitinophagales bacterium]|nr:queuosine precursor transporter [Chitinophagales bacterium]MDW8419128.1 queuosine precursor transporter [Chitinophagales bacterium]
MKVLNNKPLLLYIVLAAFFLTNALVAEFMGVKIFSLDDTLGLPRITISIFGEKIEGISLTCGVLLWPFVFIMTDIINEYFGPRGVRLLSVLAACMIGYAFIMLYAAMNVIPAAWWIYSSSYGEQLNMEYAFRSVFGQGMAIIAGSLTAFLIGQLMDVYVFNWVKRKTGEKFIWLRATGSTVVSQLIDSFVVLFIAFYVARIGQDNQWSMTLLLAVGTVNYLYKFIVAVLLTPVIYVIHYQIDAFLGEEMSLALRQQAMHEK